MPGTCSSISFDFVIQLGLVIKKGNGDGNRNRDRRLADTCLTPPRGHYRPCQPLRPSMRRVVSCLCIFGFDFGFAQLRSWSRGDTSLRSLPAIASIPAETIRSTSEVTVTSPPSTHSPIVGDRCLMRAIRGEWYPPGQLPLKVGVDDPRGPSLTFLGSADLPSTGRTHPLYRRASADSWALPPDQLPSATRQQAGRSPADYQSHSYVPGGRGGKAGQQ
jgi:hypothetical protein